MATRTKVNGTHLAEEEREEDQGAAITTAEKGVLGIRGFAGVLEEAYSAELRYPTVQPLYSRLRRSDPEIGTVLNLFTSVVRTGNLTFQLPENANDDEKKFAEFGEQVLEDIEGGSSSFLETVVSQVPFFGWGSWYVVNCFRNPEWVPPGDSETEWRSQFNDGLVGIRKLAFRDTSTFSAWESDNQNNVFKGWWQSSHDGLHDIYLPFKNLVHLRLGDLHNPEGLSPLEKVWRLERIKYGLELVQGIGFEHAAGYFSVSSSKKLTPADHALIRKAARAVQTAVQGNFVALPQHLTGEIKDVSFSAGSTILEAIRYYCILKLMAYMMQWVAMSTISGTGSFSAIQDGSSFTVEVFNSMMAGFADQIDNQIGRRLLKWNAQHFLNVERRPKLIFSPIPAKVKLGELGSFLSNIVNWMPLGQDDVIAIRKQTGFMPDNAPPEDQVVNDNKMNPVPFGAPTPAGDEDERESVPEEANPRAEEQARAMKAGVEAFLNSGRNNTQ